MTNVMLANEKKYEEVKELKWRFEVKEDGSRCISNNGILVARARSGKPPQILNKKYPHIKINNPDTIVDGEIIVRNKEGLSDFGLSQKKEHWPKAVYVVFDVLKFEGELIAKKPLNERLEYLKKLEGEGFELIKETTWEEVLEKEMEGMMVKNLAAPYQFRRTDDLIKVKNWKYTELTFDHYEKSDNPNWKGIILISNNKDRVACAGSKSEPIKARLDDGNSVTLKIRYLMKLESNKLRMPTMCKEKE
jgi:ATP-dependent DNA ligase